MEGNAQNREGKRFELCLNTLNVFVVEFEIYSWTRAEVESQMSRSGNCAVSLSGLILWTLTPHMARFMQLDAHYWTSMNPPVVGSKVIRWMCERRWDTACLLQDVQMIYMPMQRKGYLRFTVCGLYGFVQIREKDWLREGYFNARRVNMSFFQDFVYINCSVLEQTGAATVL